MCLWRLASPSLQCRLAGLRPRRAGGAAPVQRPTGRDPGEPVVQMESIGSLLKNSLLLREASLFVLFRLSADWMRPTHIMEGGLLTHSSLV